MGVQNVSVGGGRGEEEEEEGTTTMTTTSAEEGGEERRGAEAAGSPSGFSRPIAVSMLSMYCAILATSKPPFEISMMRTGVPSRLAWTHSRRHHGRVKTPLVPRTSITSESATPSEMS